MCAAFHAADGGSGNIKTMGGRMMMDFELPGLTACQIPESFKCVHGDVTFPGNTASLFFGS
jgi:hypothetical protein